MPNGDLTPFLLPLCLVMCGPKGTTEDANAQGTLNKIVWCECVMRNLLKKTLFLHQ